MMSPILPLPPPSHCLIAKLPLISVCLSACGGDAQLGEYKATLNQREGKKDRATSWNQFCNFRIVFHQWSRALKEKHRYLHLCANTVNPSCLTPSTKISGLLTPVNFCLNLKLYIYLRGFYKYVILATAKTKLIQDPWKERRKSLLKTPALKLQH